MIEVVAAVGILTVVVGALILSQIASINLTRSEQDSDAAIADLRAAMEEILLVPQELIPDPGGPYAPNVPIAKWEGMHLEDESIVPTYPNFVGAQVPDPLEILLTCTWTDFQGRDRVLTLGSMKTK